MADTTNAREMRLWYNSQFFLHNYRGMVAATHPPRPADASDAGRAYMLDFGIRAFGPKSFSKMSRHLREKLRPMNSAALDFRAAQNGQAIGPRGGPWFSFIDDFPTWRITLISPLHGRTIGFPEDIDVNIRATRSPAHLNVTFGHVGVNQNVPSRPLQTNPAFWRRGAYEGIVAR